jgi:alkylhydroperoxidase family enzyme
MAHGRVLADQVLDPATVTSIMKDNGTVVLEPRERAMMAFATKVVVSPECITAQDHEELRGHGFSDSEIFDIAAAATARSFFAKLLDALGVQADARFQELDPALRDSLTVGRPMADPRDGDVASMVA